MNQFIINFIVLMFMIVSIIAAIKTNCVITSKLLASFAILLGSNIVNQTAISTYIE